MNQTPSSLMIALSIWARTILLNALLIGIYMFFEKEFEGALFLVLAIIIGFFATLPIFVAMPFIIHLAAKIPYKLEGRLAGLTFFLILLAVLFYAAVAFFFDENFFEQRDFHLLTLAAIVAVVLATRSVKSSFSKLNYTNQ